MSVESRRGSGPNNIAVINERFFSFKVDCCFLSEGGFGGRWRQTQSHGASGSSRSGLQQWHVSIDIGV